MYQLVPIAVDTGLGSFAPGAPNGEWWDDSTDLLSKATHDGAQWDELTDDATEDVKGYDIRGHIHNEPARVWVRREDGEPTTWHGLVER